MARKKHGAEQIVVILRQIEVELANHKNIGQASERPGSPNKPITAGEKSTAV